MPCTLDSAVLLGKETTYGTPVALTRAYEARADSFKRAQSILQSEGFRANRQAAVSTRRRTINMGGEGTLELDVLNLGMGFLLQGLLGATTGPTQDGATDAYDQSHTSTDCGPEESFTVQWQRVDSGGTARSFTHHGCVATGWRLSCAVDQLLALSVDFDFEDVDTSTGAGTPTYPNGVPFSWADLSITVNGSAFESATSVELNADLRMKTDRRFLRGNPLKLAPKRTSTPTFTGTINGEFASLAGYDLFVAGTVVPIVFTWSFGAADTGKPFEFVVTMPACQFTGESPTAQLEDMPAQDLPFEVLWNGTDDAVTIAVQSTDTAL